MKLSTQVDLDATPEVKTVEVDGVPYVKIMGLLGEPVLDLACVDALNLAMSLIQHGGSGLAKRVTSGAEQGARFAA